MVKVDEIPVPITSKALEPVKETIDWRIEREGTMLEESLPPMILVEVKVALLVKETRFNSAESTLLEKLTLVITAAPPWRVRRVLSRVMLSKVKVEAVQAA